jgi:hypothetical protein
MVTRTRFNVTLYVHCLSCIISQCTGHTQKNGADLIVFTIKTHHSFVYALYIVDTVRSIRAKAHTHTITVTCSCNSCIVTVTACLGLYSIHEVTITRRPDRRLARNGCSRQLRKPSVRTAIFWAQNRMLLGKLPNDMDVILFFIYFSFSFNKSKGLQNHWI